MSSQQRLMHTLTAAGHPPMALAGSDGGAALVLPFGGRVLALFAEGSDNFLWVNPRLLEVETAREALSGREWVNTGGDRTWIAPEVDVMIQDLADAWGTYRVPLALDPGHYTAEWVGNTIVMQNRARITLHRRRMECDITIGKTIRAIPNPLWREASARSWLDGIRFVGYEQETALMALPALPLSEPVGLWNILVLPAGGEMIIPTLGKTKVRDILKPTPRRLLRVQRRAVRFTIEGNAQHKIAIRAAALIGRAAFARPIGDHRWTLVVRNFQVNPSAEYVDVPWDDDNDFGYAFQSYSDDGASGQFGELEYHTPAIGGATGRAEYVDRSQVWAFVGEQALVERVAQHLLGDDIRLTARRG